jgi:BMFP domain-containing protein YqiC
MAVINKSKIQDISDGIRKILSDSPVGDVEDNINALLQGIFTKMELVNREEFDVQTAVLKRTREKLEALEGKLSAIEAKTKK